MISFSTGHTVLAQIQLFIFAHTYVNVLAEPAFGNFTDRFYHSKKISRLESKDSKRSLVRRK